MTSSHRYRAFSIPPRIEPTACQCLSIFQRSVVQVLSKPNEMIRMRPMSLRSIMRCQIYSTSAKDGVACLSPSGTVRGWWRVATAWLTDQRPAGRWERLPTESFQEPQSLNPSPRVLIFPKHVHLCSPFKKVSWNVHSSFWTEKERINTASPWKVWPRPTAAGYWLTVEKKAARNWTVSDEKPSRRRQFRGF